MNIINKIENNPLIYLAKKSWNYSKNKKIMNYLFNNNIQ